MKSYMLTPVQRQTYDYWKLDPDDDTLNIEPTHLLNYDTDVEVLVTESERLIAQLLVLHARVVEIEGEPRWVFDPEVNPEVELLHVSDEEAEEIINHQHHLFDLNQGPLAHFQVIVTPTRKFFWVSISNMLCDGWSISRISNRIPIGTMHHWTSITEEQNSFTDYLEQLEELRKSTRFERDRDWWIAYMAGIDQLTDFAVKDEYEVGRVVLKQRIYDSAILDAASQRNRISIVEALLTAWAMALRDMTSASEALNSISFITLNRGRTKQQLEVLGNFLVEKALRIDIAAEDTPVQVLEKVRHANFVTNLHSLFTEQDLEPYIGDSDRGTCVLFNEGMDHTESWVDGIVPSPRYPEPSETCGFICGILWGRGDRYELEVTYSEPLYRKEDVERFMERFDHWFCEILK